MLCPGLVGYFLLRFYRSLCRGLDLLFGVQRHHLERAETVERWGEDAGLAGLKLQMALAVQSQQANVVQLIVALRLKVLSQLCHLSLDAALSLGIADVVGLDVGLYEERVVELQLRIEPYRTYRRQEDAVARVEACVDVMRHEASQVGNDDAVVVEQQYFDMSFKFNHGCKFTAFF